jgi:adenine phosphoribosyltransferase
MAEIIGDHYRIAIGSQVVDLPLITLGERTAISLLMTIDHGVGFGEGAGADLAGVLADSRPDIVASAATLGIPVAIEVSRHLGLDDYLILQKTPKVHLGDALSEPLSSITTEGSQRLLLDRRRIPAVAGRRVALVDDVIATGGSIAASARLLRAAGAEIVAIGSFLVEGSAWRTALGDDAELVRSLAAIPMFEADSAGAWREVWD